MHRLQFDALERKTEEFQPRIRSFKTILNTFRFHQIFDKTLRGTPYSFFNFCTISNESEIASQSSILDDFEVLNPFITVSSGSNDRKCR